MKTAEELRTKYESDLEELQNTCKHDDISEWMVDYWAPGHLSGYEIKVCNICQKRMLYKYICLACKKQFTDTEELVSWKNDVLCQDCGKKGRYFCLEHKQFHNNRLGYCSKCKVII